MPNAIVAATCPVPPCNLVPRDIESLVTDLATYVDHFGPILPARIKHPERIGISKVS